MNKSFIILLLLILAIPVWFAACIDDKPEPKPEMPPLTFEGKNTFGCTINGELLLRLLLAIKLKVITIIE
ncbi:MAG TPA: hypothetical protein VEC12_13495 [Bacteroidia bacterium]|nr:hypothetical protein [Bacteroidia bacterium]